AMAGRKLYHFTVRWGEERDSDDAAGKLVARSEFRPEPAALAAVLPRFIGRVMQRPPAFSALKLGGARAYDLARAGALPVIEPRPIEIDELRLIDCPDRDHAVLSAAVGRGTYIRALARDLGRALGGHAHVAALSRRAVGRFRIEAAISLDKLAALGHSAAASEHLLPVETALDDIPALALTEAEARALRCGRTVVPLRPLERARIDQIGDGATVCAMSEGKLVALAETQAGGLRPVRVLNL
ncbi:MAG: tRNA pseudouridine(55) synthase TruB, partial [Stellaceae bacterium]